MSSSNNEIVLNSGYAVIRIHVADRRFETVPIGVAAWDYARSWWEIRLLTKQERNAPVQVQQMPFIDATEQTIRAWASSRTVPYCREEQVFPWTSSFWLAIRAIMKTNVVLGPPMALATMKDPITELEHLYQAVVQPKVIEKEQRRRIDGFITDVLGHVAKKFQKIDVPAFGNAVEQVHKGYELNNKRVIVEGVNLSTKTATQDADALVSKLQRIMSQASENSLHCIIGYVSSPGGLNGETHMRDWMRKTITKHVYDLGQDQDAIKESTIGALLEIGAVVQSELAE